MEEPSTIKYASFWLRLLAFIIDYFLVIFVLSIIIAFIITIGFAELGPQIVEQGDDLVRNLTESWPPAPYVFVGVFWLYFALMHSSPWGATVGKRIFGLYVADAQGNRINFWQATIRFLGKIISFGIFLIGFLVALFHPQRQALHDLIAKTYVRQW